MKKVLIIVPSLIFALIICAVAAPFFIDLSKYKKNIIELAKPHLGRDMDFDKIELSVMKGVGAEIQGLRIAENPEFGKGDFLTLERLRVKIKLFPLFKKQIQVKELILERPVVRLVKNTKGEFNFSDFTKDSRTDESAVTGETEEKAGEQEGKSGNALFAGLMVSTFTLHQGKIDFIEESAQQATTTTVDLLDLKFTDISFSNPISIFMAARLPGGTEQNLTIKGNIGPLGERMDIKRLSMDVAVSLKECLLGKYTSFLPAGLPLSPASGFASMDMHLKGNMATGISSEGQVQGKELVLTGKDDEKGTVKINCILQEKVKLAWEEGIVDIERLDVGMNENTLSMTGRIEGLTAKPQWDITARASGFNTDYIFIFYPSLKDALPKDVSFSGPLDMEVISKGNMDDLHATANIEMKDLDVLYGKTFRKPKQVPFQVSVKASKSGDDILLDPFVIRMHTLTLTTSGKISGLTNPRFDLLIGNSDTSCQGWELLVPALKEYQAEGNFTLRSALKGTPEDASISMQFSSPRLAAKISQSTADSPKVAPSKSVFESMNMIVQADKKGNDIRGSGNFEVKKAVVMASVFEKIQARFDYGDDILGIHGFQAHAFQGDISMDGTVEPKKYQWSAKPVIQNINVSEVMDNFTQYKGIFKGIFSGSFTASGTAAGDQKNALDASGSFRLEQGELMNLNLIDTVLNTLFGLKGVSAFFVKEGGEVDKRKTTQFDAMESEFSMASNKLNLNKLTLYNIRTTGTTGSDALIEGLVSCDTGGLDLKGKIILSPEDSVKLTKKAEPLKTLLNTDNRMVLPIAVAGNISKPRPILDSRYVMGAVANYYSKKGLDKLTEKLGLPKKEDKEQQQQSPQGQEQKSDVGTSIGNIFKELLKK